MLNKKNLLNLRQYAMRRLTVMKFVCASFYVRHFRFINVCKMNELCIKSCKGKFI